MQQGSAFRGVGVVADRILADMLPNLPPQRRDQTTMFVARRIGTMPDLTRWGVLAIGSVLGALVALPRGWALVRAVMRLPLPLVAEFPRLVRSLAVAYIWETWPATLPDGSPA